MSYDAWRRLAQIKAVEFDERERLREDREFARITERARAATTDPTAVTKAAQSYAQVEISREWVQDQIDMIADVIGDETGKITREERQLMREYVADELARERRKWRSETSVELSTVISKLLSAEREKWRRDIYAAVEQANKTIVPNKGEVLPMVRRVTKDDAA